MSANQRERLAAESSEARLQQVSSTRNERLAAESSEEREARLLYVSKLIAYTSKLIACKFL